MTFSTFKITPTSKMEKFLRSGKRDYIEIARMALAEVAEDILEDVKENAPENTGFLKSQIVGKALTRDSYRIGIDVRGQPKGKRYPKWVISGHPNIPPPITVFPKSGKALQFYWKKLGKVVTLKKVIWGNPKYPTELLPIKANPFVEKTLNDNRTKYTKKFISIVKAKLAELT